MACGVRWAQVNMFRWGSGSTHGKGQFWVVSSPIEKRWNGVLRNVHDRCRRLAKDAEAVAEATCNRRLDIPADNTQHKLPMTLLHVAFSGNNATWWNRHVFDS